MTKIKLNSSTHFTFIFTIKGKDIGLKLVEKTRVTWEFKLKMREMFVREHLYSVCKFKSLDLIIICSVTEQTFT